MRVLVASTNPGKVAELGALLARRLRLELPRDFSPPEETGETFAANALLKARALARDSGEPALADDSGLEVDALDGRPGLRSARYAASDSARIERLLGELRHVRPDERTARFRCAIALVLPDGRELVAEGTCEGMIAHEPRGAGGFGYDPVFVIPARGRTFAEMAPGEKAELSHRARAARALATRLDEIGL